MRKTYDKLWDAVLKTYTSIFLEVNNIYVDNTSKLLDDSVTIFFDLGQYILDINNISSGMIRVLEYIVDIATAVNNQVLLIDGIEDGLGADCIGRVWDLIRKRSANVQFVITSHHFHVINNLDYRGIRILQRDNNIIKIHSGKDFKLDKARLNNYDVIFNKLLYNIEVSLGEQ